MSRTLTSRTRAKQIAKAASALKAEEVVVFDLRALAGFTDFFVICSGNSDRQVQAIADAIEEAMERQQARLVGKEGYEHAQWVLLDYGDVVAHIFYPAARAFYQIERLWADAPRIAMDAPSKSGTARRSLGEGGSGA